jgi:dihydroflavonol-4-reductase
MNDKGRALVLGGTGFIGGHIVKRLAADHWEVHALRRESGSVGHVGEVDVRWHSGDLDRPDTLDKPFAQAEVLFHAAGYVPPNSRDVPAKVARSVQQTRNVCEAALRSGIEKMVYTSTLTTIGTPPKGTARLADERDCYLPGSISESAYYECKYAMESEVLRYAAAGLPAVVVNPTFVLGPGGAEGTIGSLMKLIASGWGRLGIGVEQNAVDVRDVAVGHLKAAAHGRPGERYILGGTNIRVDALMNRIAEFMHVPGPGANLPLGWLRFVARAMNFGSFGALSNHLFGIETWQALNCEKAEDELGYESRTLDATLHETIEWYRDQGVLPRAEYVV